MVVSNVGRPVENLEEAHDHFGGAPDDEDPQYRSSEPMQMYPGPERRHTLFTPEREVGVAIG